jgi:hypothetical protein
MKNVRTITISKDEKQFLLTYDGQVSEKGYMVAVSSSE